MEGQENDELELGNGIAKHDLNTVLCSSNRDFLIRNNGDQAKVDSLKGKIVGLYFSASWCGPCRRFTPKLVEVYNELLPVGKFEIVFVSSDEDDESFSSYFSKMPWLAIPFSESETRQQLDDLFSVRGIPHLAILNENGEVLIAEGVEIIQEYGAEGYPFTPEKFIELQELEREKKEAQTLESILVSKDCDFVIGKDGVKIPVHDLVGKNILLYFSAHWCPPCRAFLPKLLEAYQKIKAEDNAFEVIFISSDRDQASFDEFFSNMPWLAIPFGDKRKESLSRLFKVRGIPTLIAIGPTGKTITTQARELIMCHGADAYPFTAERKKEIEEEYEKMAEGWPKTINIASHEHELALSKRSFFNCDGCGEEGQVWSFYCENCDYDLHPKCALDKDNKGTEVEVEGEKTEVEEKNPAVVMICDGEQCRRE